MKSTGVVAISALALILGGCGDDPPVVSKTAIEKSVKDVETSTAKAFAVKDAVAFAANYTTDAVMMSPGMPAMRGREAIRSGVAGMLADPAMKLDFSADRVEVANSGDLAVTRGNYTMTMTDPATKRLVNDKGAYVTAFRKQTDGTWKAVFDINTSESVPTPPPTAPKASAKAKKKSKKR